MNFEERSAINAINSSKACMSDKIWTIKNIEYLTRNYNKIPASAIADKLNKTRNAIIGKANRMGLGRTEKNKICSW